MTRPLDTLTGHQTITNVDSGVDGLPARGVVIGPDTVGLGLQILVCDWSGAGTPKVEAMREVHRKRLGSMDLNGSTSGSSVSLSGTVPTLGSVGRPSSLSPAWRNRSGPSSRRRIIAVRGVLVRSTRRGPLDRSLRPGYSPLFCRWTRVLSA